MFYFEGKEEQHINKFRSSSTRENVREFDYNTLIQYRSMHRIYALKYTEASQTFNQFSNMKKNLRLFAIPYKLREAASGDDALIQTLEKESFHSERINRSYIIIRRFSSDK